jgi:hypothetical protein
MEILRNAIRRIAIFNELHAWKTRYFVKNNRFRIEKPKMDKEPSISPLYPTLLTNNCTQTAIHTFFA